MLCSTARLDHFLVTLVFFLTPTLRRVETGLHKDSEDIWALVVFVVLNLFHFNYMMNYPFLSHILFADTLIMV